METTFNLDWTAIIGLLAIGQAIFLCLYLALFHPKKHQAWLLFSLIFSIIVALGHDVLLHSKLALQLPQMLGFGPFSTYLSGPLVFFLVLKTLNPEREFKRFDLIHALPFVVHFISRWPKYTDAGELKLAFLQSYYAKAATVAQTIPLNVEVLWSMLTFYGHRFLYLIAAIFLLFKFKARLQHALEGRQRFAQLMIAGLPIYCVGWLTLKTVKFVWPLNIDLMINALALSVSVVAIALVLFRYSLDDIFSSKSTEKYQNSPMDNALVKRITAKLDNLMNDEKLFCDNELKQSDIEARLGLSKHLLSQALNSQGVSFNDYLNQFRLAQFKQALELIENKNADIQQLAFSCGFNSKATFYRVFKEKVGITPVQYRKQCLDSHS